MSLIKLHGREEITLKLNKKGPGIVVAGDIEQEHDVEIVNPEHVIAHLNENWFAQHDIESIFRSWL